MLMKGDWCSRRKLESDTSSPQKTPEMRESAKPNLIRSLKSFQAAGEEFAVDDLISSRPLRRALGNHL
jgi:hypothetical protein